MTADGQGVSFWGDEDVLGLDGGDGCTPLNVIKTTGRTLCKGAFYVAIGCLFLYI